MMRGGPSQKKRGLLGDFLCLFGQPYGYVDVVVLLFGGLLFSAGLLASGPEEGPADDPEDEDDGKQEQDERAFAHKMFQPVLAGCAQLRVKALMNAEYSFWVTCRAFFCARCLVP